MDDYFHSLLEQTYHHVELIIIDDASPDGSWDKIQTYSNDLRKKFSQVKLFRSEVNQGLIPTLRKLQDQLTGDLVCILESDDFYKPNKVEENVRFLAAHPEFGLVHSDLDFLYPDHTETNHWAVLGREIPQGHVFEKLLWDNFIFTCTFCCRSQLFKEFVEYDNYRKKGYITADYPCFLDLSRHTQFGYIDQSLAVYRIVPDSISHPASLEKEFNWRKTYYQTKIDYIEEYGAPPEVKTRAQKQLHKTYYRYGFELNRKDIFLEGYRWLRGNFPGEFGGIADKIRLNSLSNPLFYGFVKRFFWKSSTGQFKSDSISTRNSRYP